METSDVIPRARPADRYLKQQQRLDTPVARFARRRTSPGGTKDDHSNRFAALIPLNAPAPHEQYAFEVDLDKCTGCKACVAACHSLNGLEDAETWRDVGLIHGGTAREPYLQTVTTACHHCLEPACLNGCPVNAYEKDPLTGIVLHLDDQCIGCKYCVLKCPYDVPKFSKTLGIVRKCDMCRGRLAEGEAPACVQACPSEAIKIVTVQQETLRSPNRLLPGTIESEYTKPSTRYISQRTIPANATPADAATLRLEEPHWPLIIMLVLTQASVGATIAGFVINEPNILFPIALGYLLVGLIASSLHLGKPFKAWRAFIGLSHSWLSREIVGFGGYAMALVATIVVVAASTSEYALLRDIQYLAPLLMAGTAALGIVCVFFSAMIYHDTRRVFWRFSRTAGKFSGTTLILGAATWTFYGIVSSESWIEPSIILIVASAIKLAVESRLANASVIKRTNSVFQTSELVRERMLRLFGNRLLAGASGGVFVPIMILAGTPHPTMLAALALMLCLIGEICERYIYFRAVIAFRMPGGITS